MLFKRKREDPRVLAAKVEAVVEEFRRIKEPTDKDEAGQKEKVQMCWSPPPIDWCKINVDAVINFEGQSAGIGAVIRDNNSNFVVAAIKATKLHSDVAFVEAEAVSWGLDVAKHA